MRAASLLCLLHLCLCLPKLGLIGAESETRLPNVVVIMASELGYNDISIHGCTEIQTPRIDSIGKEGWRFSAAYAAGVGSSASIAGLLTGRHPARWGQESNFNGGLPTEEVTIAELLASRGYTTGQFGNWYQGNKWQAPQYQGFAETFRTALGMDRKCGLRPKGEDTQAISTNAKVHRVGNYPPNYLPPGWNEHMEQFTRLYAPGPITAFACDYIHRYAEVPFFLFCAFVVPWGHPDRIHDKNRNRHYLEKVPKDGLTTRRRENLGSILLLDEAVGMILDTLKQHGLDDNTLVIFTNNQGADYQKRAEGSNHPYRGGWFEQFEGGVRVPMLMKWPAGNIGVGKEFAEVVSLMDIVPTVLAASGSNKPADLQLDGVDLLPFLAGKQAGAPHERLYWRAAPTAITQSASVGLGIRSGPYKMVKRGKNGKTLLFDLRTDPGEQKNLSAELPEVLQRLQDEYQQWNATMGEPFVEPIQ